jgi:hypothetical protein
VEEAEYWATREPVARFFRFVVAKLTLRKARLIPVACCRHVETDSWDPRSLEALCVAERFADGQASAAVLKVAKQMVDDAREELGITHETGQSASGCAVLCVSGPFSDPTVLPVFVHFVSVNASKTAARYVVRSETEEMKLQADLIRHIAGDVFRPAPVLPYLPATVRDLAEAVYQQQQTAVGPLHDALLDAGLTDLAEHVHDAAEWHPKGCWAIDRLTGRT